MSKKDDVKNAVANINNDDNTPAKQESSKTVSEVTKHMREAGYEVADYRPRDIERARLNILKHCKRPRFAEKVEYNKPIGRGVRGPSIRFAECALREWGNVMTDIQVIHEDEMNRRSKVVITDLETNTTFTKEITVKKTVERRKKKGRDVLGQRTNSKGSTVYIVKATDDEIHNKEAALLSKALRNEGLRLIPSDIVDEAIEVARETLKSSTSEDPDKEKRRILDAFGGIDVMPEDLEQYLGHSVSRVSENEIVNLRNIFQAITEGSARWEDYIDDKKDKPKKDDKDKEKDSGVHERLKKKIKEDPDIDNENELFDKDE